MDFSLLEHIRNELINISPEDQKSDSQRAFKEEIKTYGWKMPQVRKLSLVYKKEVLALDKTELFEINKNLWQSGYIEEAMIACHWTELRGKDYQVDDFEIFSYWISNYVTNWATCDTFCNHSVADLVMKFPDQLLPKLLAFCESDSRWLKRAAAVTLIIPAKKGLFEETIFQIARALLIDPDDLVQKGYGWMLKSYSQFNQQKVFDFVNQHKKIMPRTALRYAIEKMPKEMKKQAMGK